MTIKINVIQVQDRSVYKDLFGPDNKMYLPYRESSVLDARKEGLPFNYA
jgi:hypothetical protein